MHALTAKEPASFLQWAGGTWRKLAGNPRPPVRGGVGGRREDSPLAHWRNFQ